MFYLTHSLLVADWLVQVTLLTDMERERDQREADMQEELDRLRVDLRTLSRCLHRVEERQHHRNQPVKVKCNLGLQLYNRCSTSQHQVHDSLPSPHRQDLHIFTGSQPGCVVSQH